MFQVSGFKLKEKGFTLIEMLVTISIIMILSVMVLAYSRKSESVSNLIRESNRVVFEIQRAQNLAMLSLQEDSLEGEKICGWGIYINQDFPQEQFILFADSCTEEGGLKGDNKYNDGEEAEIIALLKGTEIFYSNIKSIIFVPPEPKIKFDPVDLDDNIAKIQLRLKNLQNQYYEIQVSEVGQVYKTLHTETDNTN